jgi:hypothetical protein
VRNELRVARTIPSTAIALRQRAVDQAVDYISSDPRFDNVHVRLHNPQTLTAALKEVTLDGTLAEIGVYKGTSLTQIAKFFPDRNVHGFDSFVGLRVAWGGRGYGKHTAGHPGPGIDRPRYWSSAATKTGGASWFGHHSCWRPSGRTRSAPVPPGED